MHPGHRASDEHSRNTMRVDRDENDINVYIGTRIYNNNDPTSANANINAEFSSVANRAIVNNPSEYLFAIERLTVPLNGLPYFDLLANTYSITLRHPNSATESQVFLAADPTWVGGTSATGIWDFRQLSDIMNTALSTAFTNLGALPAGAPTTAPVFSYETACNCFNFKLEQAYLPTNVEVVEIYLNFDLYVLLNSFAAKYTDPSVAVAGKVAQIFVSNDLDNYFTPLGGGADQLIIRQQFNNLNKLSDIETLFLTTNEMPLDLEYDMSNNVTSTLNIPVITDFQVGGSSLSIDSFTDEVVYLPQIHRWVDMNGTVPVNRFDYRVFYTNKRGNSFVVPILPGDHVTAKYILRRKNYIT